MDILFFIQINFCKIKSIIYVSVIFLFCHSMLHAENVNLAFAHKSNDTLCGSMRIYGGLLHQHQDFFKKAFSFQGVEAGAIINHKINLGIYGEVFASNLKITIANNPRYVDIKKGGFFIGLIRNESRLLHWGLLVDIGYFSINCNNTNVSFFSRETPVNRIHGFVLMPQVYGELNVTRWMKFRTGIGYGLYGFHEQSVIKKEDLQNVSINFGFMFGRFGN